MGWRLWCGHDRGMVTPRSGRGGPVTWYTSSEMRNPMQRRCLEYDLQLEQRRWSDRRAHSTIQRDVVLRESDVVVRSSDMYGCTSSGPSRSEGASRQRRTRFHSGSETARWVDDLLGETGRAERETCKDQMSRSGQEYWSPDDGAHTKSSRWRMMCAKRRSSAMSFGQASRRLTAIAGGRRSRLDDVNRAESATFRTEFQQRGLSLQNGKRRAAM